MTVERALVVCAFLTPLCRGSLKLDALSAICWDVHRSAPRNETAEVAAVADCNGLEFIAPRAWVAKDNPRLCESSFDLHHGLDVSEDEIDTVPAELLNDLLKR